MYVYVCVFECYLAFFLSFSLSLMADSSHTPVCANRQPVLTHLSVKRVSSGLLSNDDDENSNAPTFTNTYCSKDSR